MSLAASSASDASALRSTSVRDGLDPLDEVESLARRRVEFLGEENGEEVEETMRLLGKKEP